MKKSAYGSDAQRLFTIVTAALTGFVLSLPSHALVIHPTFTGLSAAVQTEINSAIQFYEQTFSDPITVEIEFHDMADGLGRSDGHFYFWSYDNYRNALIADATSPSDTLAVATLPAGATDPILGKPFISLRSATGRAIGLPTPGLDTVIPGICNFTGDGCIGINVAETTVAGGSYSLFSIAQHEIDEVLGLGSSLLNTGVVWQGFVSPADLYRYQGPGVRSFSFDCFDPAYFSIDGGQTNLSNYHNCLDGGDYGDWVTHTPGQVQDAYATLGEAPFLTKDDLAVGELDVVGYTFAKPATPASAPGNVLLLATALLGMVAFRRRSLPRAA